MPRVYFTESFDWHVKPNVTVHHKAGHEYVVPEACAAASVASGKGRLVPTSSSSSSSSSKAKVATDAGE